MDYCNEKAPEPEIRKSLKEYTFNRTLNNDNNTPEGNNNKDLKEQKKDKD